MILLALLLGQAAPTIASAKPSDPALLRSWYASGQCLVARNGVQAEAILDTRPQSLDFLGAFLTADTRTRCFDQRRAAVMHENATRGAVAEALLLRDFSAVGTPRGKHVAKVFMPLRSPVAPAAGEKRAIAFLEITECVAEKEPALSFQLFSTEIGSREETAAVRALVPALGACLSKGLQVPMNASYVRSFLAEAVYRVSVRRLSSPDARIDARTGTN